uniref:Uncharacterized protein n=1 Tax=Arundo donax TaxID=35708 RepID=A0A0A9FQT9_ARUDO
MQYEHGCAPSNLGFGKGEKWGVSSRLCRWIPSVIPQASGTRLPSRRRRGRQRGGCGLEGLVERGGE